MKLLIKTVAPLIMAVLLLLAAGCSDKESVPPAANGAASSQPTKSAENGNVFNSVLQESDGGIYVDGAELTVTLNIARESTDYWDLRVPSGDDVLPLLDNSPPGKNAQYGHSWIFTAVKSGKTVMEFTLYEESGSPKGNGYRFAFYVDDSLNITSDANVTDITNISGGQAGKEGGGFEEDATIAMLTVIAEEVYETDSVSFEVSSYPFTLLGEESDVYDATCGNGRKCMFIALADGSVYINENEDTPNFKRVSLGNYIVIAEPVNDYSWANYDEFAQEVINYIAPEVGTASANVGDYGNVIIDHRQVRVYGINLEFDVGGFVAFDDTMEYVYYDPAANGIYYKVYDAAQNGSYTGEEVTVLPGL